MHQNRENYSHPTQKMRQKGSGSLLLPLFRLSGRQLSRAKMPKAPSKKRNSASQASPYAQAAAKIKAANNVFRMNTDIGQHVLKNPGVAQAIVDKADLKQSDVYAIQRRTPIYNIYIF